MKLVLAPLADFTNAAFRKLASEGITIDTLTPEQHLYIYGE